jgi:protein-disulfide isomerase
VLSRTPCHGNGSAILVCMEKAQTFAVPLAIVAAGVLIAAAVYMTGGGRTAQQAPTQQTSADIPAVTSKDHIRGNPNAQVVVVEYTDTECPFCKKHDETMRQILATYGDSGKVAWVYRPMPLAQLHSNAPKQAEALECAGDLGGEEVFWKYHDIVFDRTTSNNTLDMSKLPEFAKEVGLDVTAFNKCLSSGKFTDKINKVIEDGFAAGAQGTPYTVIISGGNQQAISGAQPFENFKAIIDTLIQ